MEYTVTFKTLGCKQNQYDTDFLRESFLANGFRVQTEGVPDLVVVNTCTVTMRSAQKCRQAIRAAARAGSKVVVTGCYGQVAPEELSDIPGVILVTGVTKRADLASMARRALEREGSLVEVSPHSLEFEETPVLTPSLTRAYLKVQEGCDDYCTYCIVPYARGPSRSRDARRVVSEAQALVERGYKEIILTGTHIGLYSDLASGAALSDLVRAVSDVPGLARLRISSLEPHDVTKDFVQCLRLPNVCDHLHLPLQSGSDHILRRMGRRYDSARFLEIVGSAREKAPDLGLTTDIIVGFPGETEEDFLCTLRVAREARFSRIHVFRYSPRAGTPAAGLPGRVSGEVSAERSGRLQSLSQELSLEFHRKHIGEMMELLVEDDRDRDGMLGGFTRNYIRCRLSGEDQLVGNIISVTAEEASSDGVLARRLAQG